MRTLEEIIKLLKHDYKTAYPDIEIKLEIGQYSIGPSVHATVTKIPRKYLLNWQEIEHHLTICNCYGLDTVPYFKEKYENNEMHIAFIKANVYANLQRIHQTYNHGIYYGSCEVNGAEIIDNQY